MSREVSYFEWIPIFEGIEQFHCHLLNLPERIPFWFASSLFPINVFLDDQAISLIHYQLWFPKRFFCWRTASSSSRRSSGEARGFGQRETLGQATIKASKGTSNYALLYFELNIKDDYYENFNFKIIFYYKIFFNLQDRITLFYSNYTIDYKTIHLKILTLNEKIVN